MTLLAQVDFALWVSKGVVCSIINSLVRLALAGRMAQALNEFGQNLAHGVIVHGTGTYD